MQPWRQNLVSLLAHFLCRGNILAQEIVCAPSDVIASALTKFVLRYVNNILARKETLR